MIRRDLCVLRIPAVDPLRQQSYAFCNKPELMPEGLRNDLEVPARFRMRGGVLLPHRVEHLAQFVVHLRNLTSAQEVRCADRRNTAFR